MLTLLLLLHLGQVTCLPADSTIVCDCKQGRVTSCDILRETDSKRFKEVEQALQAARQVEEQLRQQEAAKAAESKSQTASGAPEPPDCKGQLHHIISRRIANALESHPTLSGIYEPRDPRFVSQAVDEKAHCGYQDWHRKVDEEVIDWLDKHRSATRAEFEEFLRSIYKRPDMRARFPNGF